MGGAIAVRASSSSSSSSSFPYLYAGFDGGGTRTTCVLCDQAGTVLGVGTGGRSNYHDIGMAAALTSLKSSFDEALKASGLGHKWLRVEACFGLAGLDSSKDMLAMTSAIASMQLVPDGVVGRHGISGGSRRRGKQRIEKNKEEGEQEREEEGEGPDEQRLKQHLVENDWRIAVKGAFIDEPGVTLIAGTGCVAAVQSRGRGGWSISSNSRSSAGGAGGDERGGGEGGGRAFRVGGWGHIVDDRGSGYDIGREALYVAMRDYDGRGPKTLLLEMLMQMLQVDEPQGIIARVYAEGMSVSEIASLSPLVSRAAAAGDPVALAILADKGRLLGELVVTAASKVGMLDTPFGVSLNGGVFKAGRPLLEPMEKRILSVAPRARIVEPRLTPACGAVVLLLERAGIRVDDHLVLSMRDSFDARVQARGGGWPLSHVD
jgi:N-acetylglucosamine kinase-like BadF-type ATPase